MAIKRILLPLAGDEGAEALAECAFLVGSAEQAQVQGLLIRQCRPYISFGDDGVDPELLRQLEVEARKEWEETRQRVERMFGEVAAPYQPLELRFTASEGDLAAAVAHAARLSDLSVVGGARYEDGGWREVRDVALFQSGRPVLVVPDEGVKESTFDRVVIAWKESIEAARAVAAAQPFLRRAREVHLLTVGESADLVASLEDVEQYLLLHYAEIKSDVIPHTRSEAGVADAMLDKSHELGDALLVTGAYSHWRWREQLFGGVTEAILARARVPVLMAH
jgi:nucleotide-binding universal stress UspA family protein